jgi:DNA replication protein DnaC
VYWPITWEDLESRRVDMSVFDSVRTIATNPEKAMKDHLGIYLSGPVGSCKTTVAILLAKQWALKDALKVRYVLYSDLYRVKCGTKEVLLEESDSLLTTTNLLVLDEVGREPVAQSEYDKLVLDEVLRKRESCSGQGNLGAVTVITTNIPFEKMRDRYSDNVQSLLQGRFLPLVLKSRDVRKELGEKLRKEWMGNDRE